MSTVAPFILTTILYKVLRNVIVKAQNKKIKKMKLAKGINENDNFDEDEVFNNYQMAKREAFEASKEGYVQHVNISIHGGEISFEVSDWYDGESTVASFENGQTIHDEEFEYYDDIYDWVVDNVPDHGLYERKTPNMDENMGMMRPDDMSSDQEHAMDQHNHSEFEDGELSNCCGAPIVMGDICADCGEHTAPAEPEADFNDDMMSEEVNPNEQEYWSLYGSLGEKISEITTIGELMETFRYLYSKLQDERAIDALIYFVNERKADMEEEGMIKEDENPCWKGYKQVGMKEKDGKQVPNCVPNKNESLYESLQYHIDNRIPLTENVYRYGSKSFFELINEARELYTAGKLKVNEADEELLNSDIGKKGIYEGKEVWLDIPMITEDEIINEAEYQGKKVSIGKPKRGGSKAYHVYVKGCGKDKSKVKKINFGSGMKAKLSNPEAKKNYNARHGCSKGRHNDRCKAGYWSCRLPRFAKSLGLSGSGTWW
jgi:hypothetical protein